MKRIIITGATGMIGVALVNYAVSKKIEVTCLVRKDSDRLRNLPDSEMVHVRYCGVEDYSNFYLDEQYDVFYHLAWDKTLADLRDDIDSQLLNIKYTLAAVRLAKRLGCKKFIGAGSQAEYGIATEPLGVATSVNPLSGYGIAKYTAGKLSRLLCEQVDINFNWVRILSVYGPFDGGHTLIMYTINELLTGRTPELTKCEQTWDYLHCDDSARALLAIGEKGKNGKIYSLGSGEPKKLSVYLEILRDIVAPGIELQFGTKEYYPHQPMFLCADISELINDTGFKPITNFEEGIRMTVEFVRAQR
ncbi:MAG: NAD(P)-dependent oxidoreductase [Lachnospiraceae bacterium]|nr:NAD(P)-dependent oxidoreductase [Lachnospiraceae bacterium]